MGFDKIIRRIIWIISRYHQRRRNE